MQAASGTLVAAIGSHGQIPTRSVMVDFDRDGYAGIDDITKYATSLEVQRSLTTDLPDGTRLVAGYSTASATLDLAGDPEDNNHNGSWTWAPTNDASPYYGKKRVMAPARIQLGFTTTAGAEVLTRFVGTVRTIDTDGAAGTAEMQILDGSDQLRNEIQLPMWTVKDHPSLDGRTFIDYILAQNNITGSDLEPSLNPLTATPYVQGKQDAWTLIQQIAAAEMAVAFFDETGRFHFWNRHHFTGQSVDYDAMTVTVRGMTSPIPQVTSARALKTLTFAEAVDSVRNHIRVHWTNYEIQPLDIVWQSNDPIRLGIGETRTVWADFDTPVINLQTAMGWIGRGSYIADGKSGFRASRRLDGTGNPVGNLSFDITAFAQRAKITITNPNPFWCFLVSPKKAAPRDPTGYTGNYGPDVVGTPHLWLRGQAVVDRASQSSTTDGASGLSVDVSSGQSISAYGEQLYELDTNGWIQDESTARLLASDLLALLSHPMPTIGDVEVVADPRLQIGDRIQLVDETGTQLDEHCWIVGITDTFTPDGVYSQTLTLRMCSGIGGWILGHPTRSVLGQTTVVGGVY